MCGASPSAPPCVPRGYLLINALFIVCSPPPSEELLAVGEQCGGAAVDGQSRGGLRCRGGAGPCGHPQPRWVPHKSPLSHPIVPYSVPIAPYGFY